MFELDADQQAVFNTWTREHAAGRCPYHIIENNVVYETHSGAVGGALTYSFTPMSIGLVVKVKCACGEEKDLTAYDEW